MNKVIRLGTRGSPLALVQAEEVRKRLTPLLRSVSPDSRIEIVTIKTKGDWKPEHQERRFLDMGGNKELFTKEIEDSLINHETDLAVHSMKDMSSVLPPGLSIVAVLEREDPRDAFISTKATTLDNLAKGSVVGTSSLRRQAQILSRRPDLIVKPLRGNVETRLQKLDQGLADATLLAVAGLSRLGHKASITSIMPPEIMLPAAAQGVIGIEIRSNDEDMRTLIAPLNVPETHLCVTAERAMLRYLDGSCKTPIGAYAHIKDNRLMLDGLVARPDGSSFVRLSESGPLHESEALGTHLGEKLKGRVPADYFAA